MSDDDVRRRLLAEQRRTAERLERLRADFDEVVAASRDTNADDEHDPEGATIAFERSQTGSLVTAALHHRDEVAAALGRLDAGAYGRCEACGAAIPAGRLEARPTARTCVPCA